MYPTNLTTNEVKNSAGTEVEFLRRSNFGTSIEFAQSGETPNLEHRLKVSHQEIGSGVTMRRRSLVRVDKTVEGASGVPRVISCYIVVDIPVGDISDYDDVKDALANLISNVASQGATTTILFDCSGYGADALVNGTL